MNKTYHIEGLSSSERIKSIFKAIPQNASFSDQESDEVLKNHQEEFSNWDKLYDKLTASKSISNLESILALINTKQVIMISQMDASAIFYKAGYDKLSQEVSYRVLSLMVYEMINDFSDLIGNKFRTNLQTIFHREGEEFSILNTLKNDLQKLKQHEFYPLLKTIRNSAIGHKDLQYKNIIAYANPETEEKIFTVFAALQAWHADFEIFFNKAIKKYIADQKNNF